MLDLLKRHTSWLALSGLLSLSTLGHAAESAPDALRIGYQKGSVSMVLAKSHHTGETLPADQNLVD